MTRRPENSGNFVATFTRGRFTADLTGYFRGRTLFEEPSFGASNGLFWNSGFANVGVNLNYALGHGVTAYGNLRNALNRHYEEIFGFPSPRLNFVAGMKWTISRCADEPGPFRPTAARHQPRLHAAGRSRRNRPRRRPARAERRTAHRRLRHGRRAQLVSSEPPAQPSTSSPRGPQLAILAAILLRVQHELFNLGSILATLPEDVHPKQARVTDKEIRQLEVEMDRMNEDLAPLRSFVLPGGSRLNAELHICRTVCRRAERDCVTLGRVRKRAAGSHPLPEPVERRAVRLEPVGQPHHRRARNLVGTEPVRLRAAG